jgi:hypothetical protein
MSDLDRESFRKSRCFQPGVGVASKKPDAARALIKFLASPTAASAITRSGLELVTSQ